MVQACSGDIWRVSVAWEVSWVSLVTLSWGCLCWYTWLVKHKQSGLRRIIVSSSSSHSRLFFLGMSLPRFSNQVSLSELHLLIVYEISLGANVLRMCLHTWPFFEDSLVTHRHSDHTHDESHDSELNGNFTTTAMGTQSDYYTSNQDVIDTDNRDDFSFFLDWCTIERIVAYLAPMFMFWAFFRLLLSRFFNLCEPKSNPGFSINFVRLCTMILDWSVLCTFVAFIVTFLLDNPVCVLVWNPPEMSHRDFFVCSMPLNDWPFYLALSLTVSGHLFCTGLLFWTFIRMVDQRKDSNDHNNGQMCESQKKRVEKLTKLLTLAFTAGVTTIVLFAAHFVVYSLIAGTEFLLFLDWLIIGLCMLLMFQWTDGEYYALCSSHPICCAHSWLEKRASSNDRLGYFEMWDS